MPANERRHDRLAKIEAIHAAAIEAADPFAAIERAVSIEDGVLRIRGHDYALAGYERIVVVGAGKAGAPMAAGLEAILGERISAGLVVVQRGFTLRAEGLTPPRRIRILEADHPIPDESGLRGAEEIVALLSGLDPRDLVIALFSGGGSALLPLPAPGISLADIQALTEELLRCGATIDEINAVRKHVSWLQGGQLAKIASPATIVSLIISDVVGDRLDVVASGPTVPDPTTFADAWDVLEKRGIASLVPAAIAARIRVGLAGEIPETPKPGDPIFSSVRNVVIAGNETAARAAAEEAARHGLRPMILTTHLEGEARDVGRVLGGIARSIAAAAHPMPRPACIVAGGETTVTVRGPGKGGRNQEVALGAALAIEGLEDVAVVSIGTDGVDGMTDAAGAVAWGDTIARARAFGLDARRALAENDAYPFFRKLGDLIITGPTNTNVNDIALVLAFGR